MCWQDADFLILLTKIFYYSYQLFSLLIQCVSKHLVLPGMLHCIWAVISSDKDLTLDFIWLEIKWVFCLWRKWRLSRELEKYKISRRVCLAVARQACSPRKAKKPSTMAIADTPKNAPLELCKVCSIYLLVLLRYTIGESWTALTSKAGIRYNFICWIMLFLLHFCRGDACKSHIFFAFSALSHLLSSSPSLSRICTASRHVLVIQTPPDTGRAPNLNPDLNFPAAFTLIIIKKILMCFACV